MRDFFSSEHGQLVIITIAVALSGLAGVAIALCLRW